MANRQEAQKSYEVPRRIWHSGIGFLICILYFYDIGPKAVFFALLPIIIIYGGLDYYRLSRPNINRTFCNSFPLRWILRREERTKMTSSFYFLLGVEVILLVFSLPVIVLSLLYLSWCDPIAAIIGKTYGPQNRSKRGRFWNGKSYVGSGAAAALGMIITMGFLLLTTRPLEGILGYFARLIMVSVLGGIIASVSELVTVGDMDDNFTMPIISALLLSLFTPIQSLYAEII